MESSLVSKKRRVKSSKAIVPSVPRTTLESLPKEMIVQILKRLSKEEISRTLCLSKSFREKVMLNCLPLMKNWSLSYHGLLLQFEAKPGLYMGFDSYKESGCPTFDHYLYLKTCERMMQCNMITSDMLLDCCNGLLLFCHHGNNVENLVKDSFYYFVINPVTKQAMAVLKPNPKTSRFRYASLAYDPAESSFFKIVQFQGSCQLNIFDSEKGEWEKTMVPKLPKEIIKSPWKTKAVYNKGALFRVTKSGYLVKFLVGDYDNNNSQGGADNNSQVVAIELPSLYLPDSKCTLGTRGGKIIYASLSESESMSASDSSLHVWELSDEVTCEEEEKDEAELEEEQEQEEQEDDDDDDEDEEEENNWDLLNVVECNEFHSISTAGQVLAIHPYREVVFMLEQPYFYCARYSTNTIIYQSYSSPPEGKVNAFPVFKCTLPFTCTLNKKDPNTFQHININATPRKKERYRAFRMRAINYWPSG